MIGIVSFIVIITISLVITKIATIALVTTGLSEETAKFQARSALSGVGYTTDESEKIVSHPIRRRIVMFLMLIGNAGIVTSVTTLILAFLSKDGSEILPRLLVLAASLLVIWRISNSRWFNRWSTRGIEYFLKKYTDLAIRDYLSLLRLSGEYQVVELFVEQDDWLSNKNLKELKLWAEGVLVLSIERDGEFWGVPSRDIVIQGGDRLVLYGRETAIKNLDNRKAGHQGDQEHFRNRRLQDKLSDLQLDEASGEDG